MHKKSGARGRRSSFMDSSGTQPSDEVSMKSAKVRSFVERDG
jgi:hypothetical protein